MRILFLGALYILVKDENLLPVSLRCVGALTNRFPADLFRIMEISNTLT